MLNQNAKWIWINRSPKRNEFAVFEENFVFSGKTVLFTLCAETDYVLSINGKLASFGQFAGYPQHKYYDEIDITEFCTQGENKFTLTVRYEGLNTFTHIDDGAGVIYSLEADGQTLTYSHAGTLGGYDHRYVQHVERLITPQIGFSSDLRVGDYRVDLPCAEVEKSYHLKPRPVKKLALLDYLAGIPVVGKENIYDLGRETAGYLCVKFKATKPCRAVIAYGEHLADGAVRYQIGARNFSLGFELDCGIHEFQQFFVRIAGRYLQAILPEGAELLSIGMVPALYPITEKPFQADTVEDQKIYDTCVRTLRLCMNTHYEDCPWREQALYVLDSRNQMLFSYACFEETDFARENLKLIAKGTRDDGFLELTYPAQDGPAIPFFSLMYPVAVYEYIQHTGDMALLAETMPTMLGIMNNLKSRIERNGLIRSFQAPYWNFFEWTQGSADAIPGEAEYKYQDCFHLILNCAFVYSGTMFAELCKTAGIPYTCDFDAVKRAIVHEFYHEATGLFHLRTDQPTLYSQLGNAFALLIGLGDARTAEALKNDPSLIPASLSMLTFYYDALLAHDSNNRKFILHDIREKYGYMLNQGATSFWETIDGEAAFSNAGSLCHGWSALPIFYYHKFKAER